MGTGEYHIRQDGEGASSRQPDGDLVHPGVEHAAEYRVSQIEGRASGPFVAKGSRGEDNLGRIRQATRSFLPVRPEFSEGNPTRHASNDAQGDFPWSSVRYSSGGSGPQESDLQIGAGSGRDGQETGDDGSRSPQEAGCLRSSTPKASKCFLDKERTCDQTCVAYVVGVKDPCRLLSTMDRLLNAVRPGRPAAPPPPKVIP